jgi:DNA-binding beta-propeller fold protein YncE
MKTGSNKYLNLILLVVFSVALFATPAIATVRGTYLYNLSNFTGTIPYEDVRIFFDRENNEIYVSNRGQGTVKIFNENGMEVYSFGEDADLGSILDGQVEKDGNILLLSHKVEEGGPKYFIIRCNFRGEATSATEIKGLPGKFSDFGPSRMVMRNGNLYLADLNRMKVAVTDLNGLFKDGYDIAAIIELTEQQRADSGLVGFSVDREGSIFFTIPVFFRAYKLTPDRNLTDFGRRGSGPGRFNVISGIVTDDKGYIYVADKLRCVVMIFDKAFSFQNEFGFRGLKPGRLIVPNHLEIDAKDRFYVTQMRKRGISVYQIKYQ